MNNIVLAIASLMALLCSVVSGRPASVSPSPSFEMASSLVIRTVPTLNALASFPSLALEKPHRTSRSITREVLPSVRSLSNVVPLPSNPPAMHEPLPTYRSLPHVDTLARSATVGKATSASSAMTAGPIAPLVTAPIWDSDDVPSPVSIWPATPTASGPAKTPVTVMMSDDMALPTPMALPISTPSPAVQKREGPHPSMLTIRQKLAVMKSRVKQEKSLTQPQKDYLGSILYYITMGDLPVMPEPGTSMAMPPQIAGEIAAIKAADDMETAMVIESLLDSLGDEPEKPSMVGDDKARRDEHVDAIPVPGPLRIPLTRATKASRRRSWRK